MMRSYGKQCVLIGLALAASALAGELDRKPAVYFYDFYANRYNSAVVREILDGGFEVGKNTVDFPKNRWLLSWEELKTYNVLVLVGMPNDFSRDHAAMLDRFLEMGGGILFMPIGTNDNLWEPSRWYLEERLGLKIFIEQIKHPDRTFAFKAADGRIAYPIAWTDAVAESPVTRGVDSLWYPVDRGSQYYNTAPLRLSTEWQALVTTGPGAHTVTKADGDYVHSEKKEVLKYSDFKGGSGDFTIAAVRDLGGGRVAALGISPQLLLWGGYIPAYDGVLMKSGAQGRPSHWSRLLINLYRYLAEPSMQSDKLGGHVTKHSDVFSTDPGDPTTDFREELAFPPSAQKVQVGIIGARSSLSSGRNSVAEWSAAARQKGYDFLVFAEDMKQMTAEKWLQLRQQCRRNSDDSFLAFPGVEFEAEIGDRGFYMDDLGFWPDPVILTADGRIHSSRMAEDKCAKMILNFRSGMKPAPGVSSWVGYQLAMGHFAHGTNPTPWWNHNLYQLLSVYSREHGNVLDDWTIAEYLEVNAQKLHVAPIALELMDGVSELPLPFTGGAACMTYPGELKQLPTVLNRLGNYGYSGLSSPLSVSSGPVIREWNAHGSLAYVVPRWLTGPRQADFYKTPNYRMRLRLSVAADAGLEEVLIYDGIDVWRRFRLAGEKTFAITMAVLNDNHSHFVAVITDVNGGKAVTGELEVENWLNRVYWCSDRCNFGSRPHMHNAGVMNPVHTTMMSTERTLLNRWTFPLWGPDCGVVQGNVETMFCKGAIPDNGWVSYFDTEPIPGFTWVNQEYVWYQQHGRRFVPVEDYQLQGWDQAFAWSKGASSNEPFFPYVEKTDVYSFTRETTFDGHQEWSIEPAVDWRGEIDTSRDSEYELRLGDQRLSGTIPRDKALNLTGAFPSGSIVALRLWGAGDDLERARAGTAIVWGEDLFYQLQVHGDGRHMTLRIGFQENGTTVPAGTVRTVRRFAVCNPQAQNSEDMTFFHRMEKEFEGRPDAGFSTALLDRLQAGNWYKVSRGTITNMLLPLEVRADRYAAMVTVTEFPFPMNSVPIIVAGLHPHWTAWYHEFGDVPRRRPVAVSPEGEARVQFDRRKKNVSIWVGHPVVCSNQDVRFDLIDAGDGDFIIAANNFSGNDVTATFSPGPACPFFLFQPFSQDIKAGELVRLRSGTHFEPVRKARP